MKLVHLALLGAVGVAAWSAAPARACTTLFCERATVWPASGTLPANLVKLRYAPEAAAGDEPTGGWPAPRLYRLDGANKVSVPFERETIVEAGVLYLPPHQWLTLVEPLPVGTVLVLEADSPSCSTKDEALSTTFTIGEAKPLPSALGTLSAAYERGTIRVADGASCSKEIEAAYVDLAIQLAADAQPFAGLFDHRLYVDGERRFTKEGKARVFADCKGAKNYTDSDVGEGKHKVRIEGTLPDGTKLVTPELSVTLRCEGPILTWGDPDAAVPDAGPKNDGGVAYVPDGGLDAGGGGVDGGSAPTVSDDDGCSLASRRSGFSGMLLALALLLRRRRH